MTTDMAEKLDAELRKFSELLCLATRHPNIQVSPEMLAKACDNALQAIDRFRFGNQEE